MQKEKGKKNTSTNDYRTYTVGQTTIQIWFQIYINKAKMAAKCPGAIQNYLENGKKQNKNKACVEAIWFKQAYWLEFEVPRDPKRGSGLQSSQFAL